MKTEITNLQILSEFAPALAELKTMKTPGNITIAAVRAFNECKKKIDEYEQARISILVSHCRKDENGKPVIENNEYKFEDQEVKSKVEEEIKKIAESKCEFNLNPIDSRAFEKVELTGNLYEILARYRFIDDKYILDEAAKMIEKITESEEKPILQTA